ncbi:MAG TPA: hypothetical protein H9861_06670 [Candidatus Ligilactobacillus excrementigallinarum]|uniref:Endonuclease n=1 Tax=Candidatus Ligilactobacillus excrementigallinarum TaxID=2838641 RepID=A0A9D1UXS2_9LACO|nr:hypothetical protein [Candidatus Ligilactobacillus excrementigallinarum]
MKIVSWNAGMKFREKFKILDEYYHADLYVIQECEDPARTKNKEYQKFAQNYLWIGDNKNKGLGVFARKNKKLEMIEIDNHYLRYILPFKFGNENFFGIWACMRYVEDLVVYFSIYQKMLTKSPIIIGDFNSNVIWDKKHGNRTQTVLNENLEKYGLYSAYHYLNHEKQGEEVQATFYLYRHVDRSYYIDYCYCNLNKMREFEIGNLNKWLSLSDHMPIKVEIND